MINKLTKYQLMAGFLLLFVLFRLVGLFFDLFLPDPSRISLSEKAKEIFPFIPSGELGIITFAETFYSRYLNLLAWLSNFFILVSALLLWFKRWIYPMIFSILFCFGIQSIEIELILLFRRLSIVEELLPTYFFFQSISIFTSSIIFFLFWFFLPFEKQETTETLVKI